ncbi:centrosomal protein of 41 kDa B-like isoform X1 [Mytilus trossulus]|uniref:centrosomal protein of 41 kDa B-like isoform X1 n=1 Tax=Mytilus trossulus TaxID=6551 RepID=UPI003006904B
MRVAVTKGYGRKQYKMSSVSTAKAKPVNVLDKKIPVNPKYQHVRATVDTGSSVTKYMEKIEDIRKNYRFKKDEIFKRMKAATFVQLVAKVWEYQRDTCNSSMNNGNSMSSTRPDSADMEIQRIQGGHRLSPAPSLALTEGDYGEPDRSGKRSTLQGVVRGVGEIDIDKPQPAPPKPDLLDDGCPYLLLDIRIKDDYDQFHMISAKSYPTAYLSRATNFETKDMLAYKNVPGKIILVCDEDERLAPNAATTLVQRGYDNLFLLSGGMRIAYKTFPEGLFTGTPNQNVTEAAKPPKQIIPATQKDFDQHDIDRLNMYLDNALQDRSTGSRLSNASTMASTSRMGKGSSMGTPKSYMSGSVSSHRAPFK